MRTYGMLDLPTDDVYSTNSVEEIQANVNHLIELVGLTPGASLMANFQVMLPGETNQLLFGTYAVSSTRDEPMSGLMVSNAVVLDNHQNLQECYNEIIENMGCLYIGAANVGYTIGHAYLGSESDIILLENT